MSQRFATRRGKLTGALIALSLALLIPAVAAAFDPALESKNFAKTGERGPLRDLDAGVQQAARAGQRRQPRRDRPDRRLRSRARLLGQRLRERRQRVRRGRPLLRLGRGELRDRQARPVHGPQRIDDLRQGLGDQGRTGHATADRDHDWIGAGARAPLLGAGRGARLPRLRRPHLRRPGSGSLRHLRRGGRPQRRGSLPGRPAVLRQHRGRARLRPLDPAEAV